MPRLLCLPFLLLFACGAPIDDSYDYGDDEAADDTEEQNSMVSGANNKDAGAGWDAQAAKDASKSWADAQASEAGSGWSQPDAGWTPKGDAGGDAGKADWSDAGKGGAGDAGKADAGSSGDSCATLTYEAFGRDFIANYCASCHGATNPRGGLRLDSLNAVVMKKAGVKSQVLSGGMPQGNKKPSDAESTRLGQWIDCGPK